MATIFVISQNAKLYSLAHRLSGEGHQVSYFTTVKGAKSIPWPEDSGPRLCLSGVEEAADLYLLDSGGSGGFGDGLAKERKLYLGGSRLAIKAATDATFRSKLGASLFPREDGDIPPPHAVRIALSGFFDGSNWLAPLAITLSTNRLMEGNRGLDIGCSGSLLCQTRTRLSVGEGLAVFLEKACYKGHVLVNAVVSGDSVVWEGIELDSEVPFLLMWMELYKGTLFELLMGLSSGLLKDPPLRREEFVLGLRLTLPATGGEEIPIPPLTLSDDKHLWPDAGLNGVVGCGWVTARGVDISEARRRVYRTVERTDAHPSLQYRRDIGHDLEQRFAQLHSWGWVG